MKRGNVAVLVGTLVWSCCYALLAEASARRFLVQARGHPVKRRGRRLQLDGCTATAGTDFLIDALGPSAADDSLFQNAAFPFELVPVEGDNTTFKLLVSIDGLATSLRESDLVDPNNVFVQEKETFGRNGEYTEEILSQNELLMDFWKTREEGPPILVAGLHSDILKGRIDQAIRKWADTEGYIELYSITDEEIQNATKEVELAIETELPDGYSNPVLSYDAFFLSVFGITGFEKSDGIVIGDGMLDFDASLGLGAVGSDILHAHEFSHALQFIMDIDNFSGLEEYDAAQNELTIEQVRDNELESDAMAAYVLAHEQGRNFEVNFLLEASKSSYFIGDCDVDEEDHHGTPRQRECATLWGADEGLDMKGDPISMREFRALFRKNLDLILALDPEVCELSEDTSNSTAATNGSGGTSANGDGSGASTNGDDGGTSGIGSVAAPHAFVVATTLWFLLMFY